MVSTTIGRQHSKLATDLRQRTKAFALRVIRLVDSLPRRRSADAIGNQLLRSGTSVAANYRASCRARSLADFIAKMGIVEEEADDWMELLIESGLVPETRPAGLLGEANELVAITVASIRTAKKGK